MPAESLPSRAADLESITLVRPRASGETTDPPSPVPDTSDLDGTSEIPVAPGTLLGGRYIVGDVLAAGGMGVVCLGRHAELGQAVAIKFLRRDVSDRPTIVQRFLNEARSAASLKSEHVVRVMDVGQLDTGRPYLVMEHLDGVDLDALIEKEGALDVDRAIEYALQVCAALTEAHANGIVHRDIKPENLFLVQSVESAGRPLVKVLDFGLAKRIDSARAMALTGPQDSMGSPYYMSPEQIVTPQDVDARSDIWSLGVVLYRLLTGLLPFPGDTILEVYAHVINAQPQPMRNTRPDLEIALDAIVLRCLQKDVTQRYQTISELTQDLLTYFDARPARSRANSNPALIVVPDEPPSAYVDPTPLVFDPDDTPIKLPGVTPRWPLVAALLLLLGGGAVYQADRTGRIDARHLTETATQTVLEIDWAAKTGGRLPSQLVPPRLLPSLEVPMPHSAFTTSVSAGPALGVYTRDPVFGASGEVLLRAEPEREAAPEGEDAANAAAPDSLAVETHQNGYRAYLKDNGLVPLKEALEKLNAEPGVARP